mgnify:CR=1 FL=1
MNYIVFDLEWNQCPKGKKREVPGLPFEIIEIGAVKLNSKREIIDKFHCLIKPVAYRKLHFMTKEIVRVTEEDLSHGRSFPKAVRAFLKWAGPEAVFATWGQSDLTELQRNMKYHKVLELLKGPLYYYDVQKLFAINYEVSKVQRSLEYGIDYLKLEKKLDFHRALSDAYYTAEIFQTISSEVVNASESINVYQNPKSKLGEIHAVYNGYSRYVSREFSSKEEAFADKEVQTTQCCCCEKLARKKIRWFSANSKNYYCVAVCPTHGYVKGKIRIKKTDEGRYFVVKTIKVSSESEMLEIKRKKDALTARRREKRNT